MERRAAELFHEFCQRIRAKLSALGDSAEESQLATVQQLHLAVRVASQLVEQWFSDGDGAETTGLQREVASEIQRLRGDDVPVMVRVIRSGADFAVSLSDLHDLLAANFAKDERLEAGLPSIVLMQLPRFGPPPSLLRPIILGHELRHLIDINVPEGLLDRYRELIGELPSGYDECDAAGDGQGDADSVVRELLQDASHPFDEVLESWWVEFVCDLYAVARFGPAAVCAIARVLLEDSTLSDEPAETDAMASNSLESPPWRLRVQLMLKELGEHEPLYDAVLRPLAEMSNGDDPDLPYLPAWRFFKSEEVLATLRAEALKDMEAYDHQGRAHEVRTMVEDLNDGRPPDLSLKTEIADCDKASVINAGWCATIAAEPQWLKDANGDPHPDSQPPEALRRRIEDNTKFSRLVELTLETNDFARSLVALDPEVVAPPPKPDNRTAAGTLTASQILHRMQTDGADRFTVVPALTARLGDTSLDLRLSHRFVVMQRTSTGWYDPLGQKTDARSLHQHVTKSWGAGFVLHPGEMVLGATLEYLRMPNDLVGTVLGRASYGTLGLDISNSIAVHPGYCGRLTLQLVNVGPTPLRLYPGERIAQLQMSLVANKGVGAAAELASGRHVWPTSPQVSRVREDRDRRALRAHRDEHGGMPKLKGNHG